MNRPWWEQVQMEAPKRRKRQKQLSHFWQGMLLGFFAKAATDLIYTGGKEIVGAVKKERLL